jgi:hypothetical protein
MRQCSGNKPSLPSQQRRRRKWLAHQSKEMTMTKFFYAALLITVLFAGASPSMARNSTWTDRSDPYGGYSLNSQEGNRAFWDYQTRHGH